jgi:hypothetical protein
MKYVATYRNKGTNDAAVNAGEIIAIQDLTVAEKNKNLPHNWFTLANLNSSCTLYIFLDNMQDQNIPDLIVFPNQQVGINLEDGISFSTMFIKNISVADNVSANEIKYNIATLKEENEVYD